MCLRGDDSPICDKGSHFGSLGAYIPQSNSCTSGRFKAFILMCWEKHALCTNAIIT